MVNMELQNLTRSEAIAHLRGKTRAELVEDVLTLHARQTTKTVTTCEGTEETSFTVPHGTARAIAYLSDSNTQRSLRRQDASLFDREPNPLEMESAGAALWDQYRKIRVDEPGGVRKRRSFRRTFAKFFNDRSEGAHF